ncbi:MAG: YlxR family protein [Oscillospiraceae bacterium]|nr:YlxR family protein [Oscillospiraceae bacterium]
MPRKTPIRMCVGCRQNLPKMQLVRVVRSPESEISVDLGGKKSGRGAYICRDEACLKKAEKTKAIQRALECEISPEIFARLREELLAEGEEDE